MPGRRRIGEKAPPVLGPGGLASRVILGLLGNELAALQLRCERIARAQSLDAARRLETQVQAQAQTKALLNYGAGYQPGSAQMFH